MQAAIAATALGGRKLYLMPLLTFGLPEAELATFRDAGRGDSRTMRATGPARPSPWRASATEAARLRARHRAGARTGMDGRGLWSGVEAFLEA